MEQQKKRCMICAREVPEIRGGICDPCQERIRREALGQDADTRVQAEKELKKHGVQPDRGESRDKR